MIDIHCHILPGIDDGAKHMQASLDMARHASNHDGITHIIATPHHRNGSYHNEKHDIIALVDQLNEAIEKENIPVTILPGQETRINGDMVEDYENEKLLTLNDSGKYLFVELPSNHIPRYTKQLLFELQLKGIVPIIVHPERNSEIIENPGRLYGLVKDGALTQVTAASVTGLFGKKIKQFSLKLIEHSLAHFIASDAHNITNRSFHLRKAYEEIEFQFGIGVRHMLQENPEYLIKGENIMVEPPRPIKKKKLFGLF